MDGSIFKSTNHGLDAEFLGLFNQAYENFANKFGKDHLINLQKDIFIKTKKGEYLINYDDNLPNFMFLK
ncbi:hypothetical protein [Tepidibacter aestuarii]|uniref:hypothetical protein n=1 Tax=Tepidibacter aestuarii TaxID=2925782 RepID=UPI0020C12786|nr:hypothetical protein [Tepidibacter aestuarii]CAH2211899.1 protein of unknown function [Tepidibacter aestuarii]